MHYDDEEADDLLELTEAEFEAEVSAASRTAYDMGRAAQRAETVRLAKAMSVLNGDGAKFVGALEVLSKGFDPNEKRDERGRWSGAAAKAGVQRFVAALGENPKVARKLESDLLHDLRERGDGNAVEWARDLREAVAEGATDALDEAAAKKEYHIDPHKGESGRAYYDRLKAADVPDLPSWEEITADVTAPYTADDLDAEDIAEEQAVADARSELEAETARRWAVALADFLSWAVEKGFDPNEQRDEGGKWSAAGASGSTKSEKRNPKEEKPAERPKLSDEQVEALRALADHFPDGIAHLLTSEGTVHPDHLLTGDEHEANEQSAEHIKAWHAAKEKIDAEDLKNAAANRTKLEDEKLNEGLNALPTSDSFHALSEGLDGEAADALARVGDELKFIEDSEAPEYTDRPDPDNYGDEVDLNEEFDTPGERADHLQSLSEEKESNAEDFAVDSETFRTETTEASSTFRDEQRHYLTDVATAATDALDIPAEDWGDSEQAEPARAAVADLGKRVAALLKTLGPATKKKGFDPNEKRDAGGKWTGHGTAGESHPLAGKSRNEKYESIGNAVGASDAGDPDPLGYRVAGFPKHVDRAAFTADLKDALAGTHAGAEFDELYEKLGPKYHLTHHDFARAMTALHGDADLKFLSTAPDTLDTHKKEIGLATIDRGESIYQVKLRNAPPAPTARAAAPQPNPTAGAPPVPSRPAEPKHTTPEQGAKYAQYLAAGVSNMADVFVRNVARKTGQSEDVIRAELDRSVKKALPPDDESPEHELLVHAVEYARECAHDGTDAQPVLDALAELADDPDTLRSVLEGTVEKAWSEELHPRSKDGRFIGKDRIHRAKHDPKLAKQLRKEVKPEDKQKLEDALSSKSDIGHTVRSKQRAETAAKREKKTADRDAARAIRDRLFAQHQQGLPLSADDLRDLVPHLSTMSHAELSTLRTFLGGAGARFGGAKKLAERRERVLEWAKGKAEEVDPTKKLDDKPKGPKRRGKIDSVLQAVVDAGGIDPESHDFLRNYESMRRATQDGIPMAAFRTGGQGLDTLAEQMQRSGLISVPEHQDAGTYVLDQLRDKAYTRAADLTEAYNRAEEEYARALEKAGEHAPAEVAEALRSGAQDGARSGAEDTLGEHGYSAGATAEDLFGGDVGEAEAPEPEAGAPDFNPLDLSDEDFGRWMAAGRPASGPPPLAPTGGHGPRSANKRNTPFEQWHAFTNTSLDAHYTYEGNALNRQEARQLYDAGLSPEQAAEQAMTRRGGASQGMERAHEAMMSAETPPPEPAPTPPPVKPLTLAQQIEAKRKERARQPGAVNEHEMPTPEEFAAASGGDKPKVEYVRAAAGGQVSDVDGRHYAGGQLMPIHGKYAGQEKGPTGDGTGSAPTPSKSNPDAEGGGGGRGSKPLSAEQAAERRAELEAQDRAVKFQNGPLGKLTNLDKRTGMPVQGTRGGVRFHPWRDFAESVGEEKLKHIVDSLPAPADPAEREEYDYQLNHPQDFKGTQTKKHARELPSSADARFAIKYALENAKTPEAVQRIHDLLASPAPTSEPQGEAAAPKTAAEKSAKKTGAKKPKTPPGE